MSFQAYRVSGNPCRKRTVPFGLGLCTTILLSVMSLSISKKPISAFRSCSEGAWACPGAMEEQSTATAANMPSWAAAAVTAAAPTRWRRWRSIFSELVFMVSLLGSNVTASQVHCLRCACLLLSRSIRRRLALSLRLCRFHPPHEIVGKARERAFKRLAAFANGFAFGRQGLSDRTNTNRAGDHHHSHLGERAVPGGCRPRTRQTSGGIAHNRGGPPEPFLQEMIREVRVLSCCA